MTTETRVSALEVGHRVLTDQQAEKMRYYTKDNHD